MVEMAVKACGSCPPINLYPGQTDMANLLVELCHCAQMITDCFVFGWRRRRCAYVSSHFRVFMAAFFFVLCMILLCDYHRNWALACAVL